MIAELGHFCLWLAAGLMMVMGIMPLAGAQRARSDWMAWARPSAVGCFVLVALSFAALTACFVQNDFSVVYVTQHSNSALPLAYRVAAVWGGHEGSLLLWVMMLVTWMIGVALFSRHLPAPVVSRILAVMALVGLGLLLFLFSAQVLAGGGNKEQIQIWPTKAQQVGRSTGVWTMRSMRPSGA